jgi:hypothetical protein
MVAGAV